jgi:hypothetical protein
MKQETENIKEWNCGDELCGISHACTKRSGGTNSRSQQTAGQIILPCEKCKKIYCEKGCADKPKK